MAYLLDIIQYKELGRLPGQRTAEPVMGAGNSGGMTSKRTQVVAAGLGAALDADTKMIEIVNHAASQIAHIRLNATATHPAVGGIADTTQASATEASSISMMLSEKRRIMLPARIPGSAFKIDVR